jgi:hypothetical protein
MQKQFRTTFDSTTGNEFTVHNRSMRKFPMSTRGLYYCDMGEQQDNGLVQEGNPKRGADGIAIVNKNKVRYSARDVALADKARKFQETTGASLQTLLDIINRKLLPNCPITRADIKMAEDIYGTSVVHLKGKTARRGGGTCGLHHPDAAPRDHGQIQTRHAVW